MEIISDRAELAARLPRRAVWALGTFDGVHRGHQQVVNKARAIADKSGAPLVVYTFSGHPLALLAADRAPTALLSPAGRRRQMRVLGVDYLVEVPFTRELAALTAAEFFQRLSAYEPQCLVAGENYSFGAGGRGNIARLRELAAAVGVAVATAPLLAADGDIISSTRIRRLVNGGAIAAANRLLGRLYSIAGTVLHGREVGRTIGFPTANIALPPEMTIPTDGAYAACVTIGGDNAVYPAIAGVGNRPTVDGKGRNLEVNLLDFAGDIYGRELAVEFCAFLRPQQKFSSLAALKEQLAADAAAARAALTEPISLTAAV